MSHDSTIKKSAPDSFNVPQGFKHTPGPWGTFWNEENARLHLGSWRFTHGEHNAVALLRCSEGNATARANARLIAAAPDLLAALQALTEASEPEELMDDESEIWQRAHAAIARATGATP